MFESSQKWRTLFAHGWAQSRSPVSVLCPRKRCVRCRKRRLLKFFHKNKWGTYGFQAMCIPCACETSARWRAKHPEYAKKRAAEGYWRGAYRWKRIHARYGLTEENYAKLKKVQRGLCALCRRRNGKKHLVVDHCHKTGKVRGLLCGGCNTALGYHEKKGWLKRAQTYLSRSRL